MYYASQHISPFSSYVHNQHKGFEDVYRADFSLVKKKNTVVCITVHKQPFKALPPDLSPFTTSSKTLVPHAWSHH